VLAPIEATVPQQAPAAQGWTAVVLAPIEATVPQQPPAAQGWRAVLAPIEATVPLQPSSARGWMAVPTAVFDAAPSSVEILPTVLAAPVVVVVPTERPVVGSLSDVAPVRNGAGRAIVVRDVGKPVPDVWGSMPTQPMVEHVTTMAIINAAEQEAAEQEIAALCGETAPDGGVDWLAWLERVGSAGRGTVLTSQISGQQIAKPCAVSIAIRG